MIDKVEFQSMKLADQITYYNTKMLQGLSMGKVSDKLGISKSIGSKFKSHGYVLDKALKQYILHIKPVEELKPIEVEVPETILELVIEPIKTAPQGKVNTNISLNIDLKRKLQIYGINNDKTLSDILNEAGEVYLLSR